VETILFLVGGKRIGVIIILVRTLEGDSLHDYLCRTYAALSAAFLRHQGGGGTVSDEIDPCLLDSAVCATELHVDLRPIRESCDLITTDKERFGEIFNNRDYLYYVCRKIRGEP
jgi:hypothetical protein